MTMLRDIALECPICGTWFRSQATDAGTRSPRTVRTTTDFRNSTEAPETLPYLVHQCVGCGFAGGDEEFGVDVPREPWAAAPVDGRELDGSDGDVAGSEKYEAAARVAALRGETPNVVADLMLRAAWCCADAGDREAERWYRREAARGYARALESYDDVPRHQRARLTYLTGELWRRAGDERLAREWFGRVNDEVTDRVDQGWLIALAVLQRNEPRDWMP